MSVFRRLSIRHKLSAIIMATSTAALVWALASLILYEQRTLRQAFVEKYTTLAAVIGINSTAALAFLDEKSAAATLSALGAEAEIIRATIINGEGRVFATYRGRGQGEDCPEERQGASLCETCRTNLKAFNNYHCFCDDYLDIGHRIDMDGEPLGMVFLRASLKPLKVRLYWGLLAGGGVLLFSLAIAYLMASWLQRLITRPIFGLAQTMQKVSADQDYTVRAVKDRDDELGRLMDGFNDMLAQIQKRDAELEQHRHQLAALVAARTTELLRANEELEEAVQALKQAQEESALAQALLTAAIEQTPAGIIIVGASGTKIRLINDAACQIMGQSKAEAAALFHLSSLSPWRFYRADGSPFLPEELPIPQALKYGRSFYNEEVRIVRPDGTERWIISNSTPIRNQVGEISAAIVVFPDITERKRAWEEKARLEAQLLQSQKMEAIGTLAGGVAHDFNNLLQGIIGYTQMLLLDKQPGERGYESLKEIDRAAQRAAELTRQLLAFSRKVESQLRPLDLNHQVKEAVRLLRRTIPRMIAIQVSLEEELQPINADPVQLEQVMLNLALNARDAMPEGGKLSFTTANVRLDESYCREHLGVSPGAYVCLTVADTGYGMDQETLAHIFEPFFTTKGKGQGTGLGLAMVYGIIQNHGAHITCASEPGRGTVFRIYFPALSQPVTLAVKEESPPALPAGGQETILLVDDEDNLRRLSQRMLERFGYKLLTAATGEEALEMYHREKDRIALVILDLIMPGMGGWRCLRELKKMAPDLKVILASGVAQVEEAQEAGADGILTKPYRLRQMLQMVRQTLDAH